MTYRVVLALLLSLSVGGCAAAQPSLEECEALCNRQGQKVAEYRVGAQVPIFKPRPSVICTCR